MSRILTQFAGERVISYVNQRQETLRLQNGGRFSKLLIQLDGQVDTTTGTLNPHPAQIFNLLDRIEVYDNNSKTYVDISGVMAHNRFGLDDGFNGDLVSAPGGANSNNVAIRGMLEIPFELTDGANPMDTLLQSVEKDLFVRLTFNDPRTNGTFFGDATGFNLDFMTVRCSLEQYRLRSDSDLGKPGAPSPIARKLKELIQPILQTNDTTKVELPLNEEYRGVFLMSEERINNIWQPTGNVIDLTKALAVKSTKDNNTYRTVEGRYWRNSTIRARRNPSLPQGLFEINLLPHGRINGSIVSTKDDELFVEVAAIKTANDCRFRILTDSLMTQNATR